MEVYGKVHYVDKKERLFSIISAVFSLLNE